MEPHAAELRPSIERHNGIIDGQGTAAPPPAVRLIVAALRGRGWLLEITYPDEKSDDTVITANGLPRRYISISEEEVVSLNQDEQGIGGDIAITSLALSRNASEREAQIREIAMWFG